MRKIKSITINIDKKTKKTFVVKELTVKEIIDLSQLNPLFGADAQAADEKAGNNTKNASDGQETSTPNLRSGLMGQLSGEIIGFSEAVNGVIEKSCEFKMEDLLDLPPSDIKTVYEGWQEVNQSFLSLLKKVGVIEAAQNIIKGAMLDFSETLATY